MIRALFKLLSWIALGNAAAKGPKALAPEPRQARG